MDVPTRQVPAPDAAAGQRLRQLFGERVVFFGGRGRYQVEKASRNQQQNEAGAGE